MYMWHTGSRWYTSDLHIVVIYIYAFIPLWYQGIYPDLEEICVKCLWPGGDSLLHVGVCWKLCASWVLVNGLGQMAVTGC